jgi:phosphogluconate dehydratase
LHLPGTAFAAPGTALRKALLEAAVTKLTESTKATNFAPIGRIVDEKSIINALVALLATGGSTNHTIHWIAVARAAGILITWDDFDDLSKVVPLLARVYPNGTADVNAFEKAGGIPYLVGECLAAGLMHDDVMTIAGQGLSRYAQVVSLQDGVLQYSKRPEVSGDLTILRPVSDPFQVESGLRMLAGNLGKAVIKTSAVKAGDRIVTAPARIFVDQDDFMAAFKAGEFKYDFVAVVRFQGPKANGMPELHKLTPALSSLMDKGFKVALLTDGRMSGASGKVAAAIHLTPEAVSGGLIAKLEDGDMITVNGVTGELSVALTEEQMAMRQPAQQPANGSSLGRGMFAPWRAIISPANEGASVVGSIV